MRKYKLQDFTVPSLDMIVILNWGPRNQLEAIHQHDCIELMFVIKGAGTCRINGQPYTATRGDIFIMLPGDTHEFIKERNFIFYTIMFRSTLFNHYEISILNQFPFFRDLINKQSKMTKRLQFTSPYVDEMELKTQSIAGEFESRNPGFEVSARAGFLQFIIYMLRHLKEEILPSKALSNKSAVACVIYYINMHCNSNLTLDKLAKKAGVSIATLSRIFKEETGLVPFDFINKVRVGKAQLELENSDKSITQIAIELGYYDSSYFSRIFKRYANVTPRAYRMNKRKV